MEIGTQLTLTEKKTKKDESTNYRCKIIDKNERFLFIDYPVNIKTKRTVLLPKGTNLQTSYIGNDHSVYSFSTKVIAKANLNIPALAISIPDKDDIKRIQRRSFVRIETAVDVSIHSKEHNTKPFVTVTSDISGGGLLVILPSIHLLNENDSLDVWIVLEMQNGIFHYISTQSRVVRVITGSNIHTASIKFENMSNHDQQVLIRYCFEKQRELRTKERI
ncbi:flagellar brake protein [Virgibacillus sp. DJP39]|uniref:flagellar brake protein n=1 Tax=Virgibacillus sp. DJP39 TaxID=3409790 RepID=UPI003BB6E5E6